jgi:tryptophan synthase alpha chain
MTSVSSCFQSLRDRHQCALIPFLTAGDPHLETTAQALQALDRAGADLIELGVPYSDPLADGPTIQAAATRALQNGVKLEDVLNLVAQVSPTIQAPIILFTYYNPILNLGIESFLQRIRQAGAAGLVVPDLPLEEADALLEPAARLGIEVILLVAPTSPPERQQRIVAQAQGFVYLVSVTGVTGMRSGMGDRVEGLISDLRRATTKPIAVGFGISDPAQARQVKDWGADGVIVGSAMVKTLAEQGVPALEQFCRQLKAAIS